IKSGGEWISSVELESQIMGHAQVLEAAVIGVPHPKWQERPAAYVVPKPDFAESLTKQDILSYLQRRVAQWGLPHEGIFIGGGAQDQRWQVRQEGAARPVRQRALPLRVDPRSRHRAL